MKNEERMEMEVKRGEREKDNEFELVSIILAADSSFMERFKK